MGTPTLCNDDVMHPCVFSNPCKSAFQEWCCPRSSRTLPPRVPGAHRLHGGAMEKRSRSWGLSLASHV